MYEHFGSTIEVKNVVGGKRSVVYARGVWKFMVDGKVRTQRLDEWPIDLVGEPIGWKLREGLEIEDFRLWDWEEEDESPGKDVKGSDARDRG